MFINNLKYPYKYKVNPNEEEDLDRLAFDLVEKDIEELIEKAYQADIRGDSKCSLKYYKAINMYYILLEYVKIIRRYFQREGTLSDCVKDHPFKLDCVKENLVCVGIQYDQDYLQFFNDVMSIAGVNFQVLECEECCSGIGTMIIENENDCVAFIVGGDLCQTGPPVPPESWGEFTLDEFINEEKTNFNI